MCIKLERKGGGMERGKNIYGIFLFFQISKQVKLIDKKRILREIQEMEKIFAYQKKVQLKAFNTNLTRPNVDFFLYLETDSFIYYEELIVNLSKSFFSLYLRLTYSYVAIKNSRGEEEKFFSLLPELQPNNPDVHKKYGFVLAFALTDSWFTLQPKEKEEVTKEVLNVLAPFSKVIDSSRFRATGLTNLVDSIFFLQSNSIFRVKEFLELVRASRFWTFIKSPETFWGTEEPLCAVLSTFIHF